MAGQLQSMLDVLEQCPATVEILVIPFSAGAHGALGGSTFHLLSFPTPKLPRVAYQETITSWSLIDHRTRVAQYAATFAECLKRAESRQSSIDLINRVRNELR